MQESNSFGFSNEYYDLFYHEKEYLKETQYVDSLLSSYGTKPTKLLELGFGTGNYSKYLSEAGYQITGIEKSEQMVAIAKSKNIPHFVPVKGDIAGFSIESKFDAAVSLFHVISYLTENAKILACFRHVSSHLQVGGVFIFDVWYTPAVYFQRPDTRVKRIHSGETEIIRIAEPMIFYEKNVVQVDYTFIVNNKAIGKHQILKETHLMRHYSTPEIELMAQLSGLTVVHSEEFLTRKKPSEDTWGVCFILKKNE